MAGSNRRRYAGVSTWCALRIVSRWLFLVATFWTHLRATDCTRPGNTRIALIVSSSNRRLAAAACCCYGSIGPVQRYKSKGRPSASDRPLARLALAQGLLRHGDEDAALVTLHQEGYGVLVSALAIASRTSCTDCTAWRLTSRMTSPRCRPARSAGLPGWTPTTMTPAVSVTPR